MASWALIDTAGDTEKDGHDLLAAFMPGGRQLVVHWSTDVPGYGWVGENPQKTLAPTHWQELPEPPAAEVATPTRREAKADAKPEPKPEPTLLKQRPGSAPDRD